MGNLCCSDDMKLTTRYEERLSEPDYQFYPASTKKRFFLVELETVKEENHEESEQSEKYRQRSESLFK